MRNSIAFGLLIILASLVIFGPLTWAYNAQTKWADFGTIWKIDKSLSAEENFRVIHLFHIITVHHGNVTGDDLGYVFQNTPIVGEEVVVLMTNDNVVRIQRE